jgi:hypothetical protein
MYSASLLYGRLISQLVHVGKRRRLVAKFCTSFASVGLLALRRRKENNRELAKTARI